MEGNPESSCMLLQAYTIPHPILIKLPFVRAGLNRFADAAVASRFSTIAEEPEDFDAVEVAATGEDAVCMLACCADELTRS